MRVRELVKTYAVESSAIMVRADEPGRPFEVEGRLVDETTGKPIAGAVIELVQADAEGFRPYYGEYLLGDDPLIEDDPGVGASLVAAIHLEAGEQVAVVTIPLQRIP